MSTAEARREFLRFELAVDRLIATAPMSALCAYDRSVLGAAADELFVVHPQHHWHGGPDFHLFHENGRIMVVGEIDVTNHRLFEVALDAVLAENGRDVVLDLRRLRFVDLGGLYRLERAVRRHGGDVRIVGGSPLLARCCEAVGLDLLVSALDAGGRRGTGEPPGS